MRPMKYRHELKYLCSEAQLMMVKNRIAHLLSEDVHGDAAGNYEIRSLYFDDYAHRCYYENENGVDPREKFRIRIYNGSAARITLELKRKERGKTYKQSCPLTIAQCRDLMRGHSPGNILAQPPLLRKLSLQMQTRLMRPSIITDYQRSAYTYADGNVRITFDRYISSSDDFEHFLDERIAKRPILPLGQHILEVKYDEYLPDFIYRNLQLENLRQTTFSKFYLCCKYSMKGRV